MNKIIRTQPLSDVRLTAVIDDRFKTSVLTAYAARPLDAEEASLNAMLPRVLVRGSRSYPNMRKISEKLCDLYGANMVGGVRRWGEYHLFGLSMDFVNGADLPEAAGFLTETLLNPLTEDGAFKPDYVTSERGKLIDALRAQRNDKGAYAIRRLEELACEGEPYSVNRLGDEERIAAITREALWKHYKNVLESSKIELFYCGPREEITEVIESKIATLSRVRVAATTNRFVKTAAARRDFTETADLTQTKFAILWRTGVQPSDDNIMAAILASVIYGGDASAKLFTHVRERLSLCYYAYASYDRGKGVVKAHSGVEPQNLDRARAEMLGQWDEVRSGNFTDGEIASAKSALINQWRTQSDSPYGLETFWQGQSLAGLTDTPQDWERRLNAVTRDEIISVARGFTLDSTYTLEPNT
ncbi:peptidase M16 [Clostridia bacterium]|nr:peptidase M16 [Clostridia bacterium]